ncbi:MAG: LbtU family siderophore porin [Nitrospirae bacterium]|nr:MAG: LbtU family siderophore porin [Nitrospirota bacterium]
MKKGIFSALVFLLFFSLLSHAIELGPGVNLGGSIQTEMHWKKYLDPSSGQTDSTSDLYLRRAELRLKTSVPSWLRTSLVINSEYLGDDDNATDSAIKVDEAVVRIQKENVPGYMEAGKRTLNFGLFENHLLTDPLTQDLYETKTVGFVLGYEKPSYDLSVTVYDSEEMINHLVTSGLVGGLQRKTDEYSDDTTSYIVSFRAYSNSKQNVLYVDYLSEPGPERNETIAAGLGLSYSRTRLYGEYFKALKREVFQGLSKEYKESAYSITLSYGAVSQKTGSTLGIAASGQIIKSWF